MSLAPLAPATTPRGSKGCKGKTPVSSLRHVTVTSSLLLLPKTIEVLEYTNLGNKIVLRITQSFAARQPAYLLCMNYSAGTTGVLRDIPVRQLGKALVVVVVVVVAAAAVVVYCFCHLLLA